MEHLLDICGLTAFTLLFIALIYIVAWAFNQLSIYPSEPRATKGSILIAIVVFGLGILFFKGFVPFLHGLRLPSKVFLIIWPLCSILLINKIELAGNVIIDALLLGLFVFFVSTVASSGLHTIMHGSGNFDLITTWLILSCFGAVGIRSLIWALGP